MQLLAKKNLLLTSMLSLAAANTDTFETLHVEAYDQSNTVVQNQLNHETYVDTQALGATTARPIVKGLSAYRVGVFKGNTALNDLSALSADHALTLVPTQTTQLEYIDGANSLLYGSFSGGLLRIKEDEHNSHIHKDLQFKTASDYVSNGNAFSVRQSAAYGDGNISILAKHYFHTASNYYANQKEVLGTNALLNQSHVVAGIKLAKNQVLKLYTDITFNTYGIPSGESGASIAMHSYNYGAVLHSKKTFGFDTITSSYETSLYQHQEGQEEKFIQNTSTLSSLMEKTFERLHIDLHLNYTNAFFNVASNEETALPKNTSHTLNAALHGLLTLDDTELGIAYRQEARYIRFDAGNYTSNKALAGSIMVDALQYFTDELSAKTSLGYINRMASVNELYFKGFHDVTSQYLNGDTNLNQESSVNLDAQLTYATQDIELEASAFYYHFLNYIYQTPQYDTNGSIAIDTASNAPIWNVVQNGANLMGAALSLGYEKALGEHTLQSVFKVEAVRGIVNNTQNIPLISPYKASFALNHSYANVTSKLFVEYHDKARYLATGETNTPAYTLVNAKVNYTLKDKNNVYTFFVNLENLGDALAYNHISVFKDTAPLRGRSVQVGLNLTY